MATSETTPPTEPKAQTLRTAWPRAVWLASAGAGALTLALTVAALPARYEQLLAGPDQRSLFDLGLSVASYAGYLTALDVLLVVVHILIASFILWRRPGDWMCSFVALALITNGALIPFSRFYGPSTAGTPWQPLANLVIYTGLASSVLILYLFPNGKFVPRWAGLLAILWGVVILTSIFEPSASWGLNRWPLLVQLAVLALWSGTGLYAQLYRYMQVSDGTQQQQTKWALFGLMAAVLAPFVYFLPNIILPSVGGPLIPNFLYHRLGAGFFTFSLLARLLAATGLTLVILVFPLSFAVAILRYRLWDIDVIIHRTLVYSTLTALLALVYLIEIVLLQQILEALTAQPQSDLVTVLSTLIIAALFVPSRRRVQDMIDRRFYRSRYDAARVLAAFAGRVQDEVELDRLAEHLLAAAQQTMQPSHASLWLKETTETGSAVRKQDKPVRSVDDHAK